MHNPQSVMPHEKFVTLFSRYESNVRAYVSSLLPSLEGVDEVMQEASLVMWRKFDQFDTESEDSSFLSWAFMIARYEVLKYRRYLSTDRFVFSEEVLELLAEDATLVANHQKQREQALRSCLKKLNGTQQELIKAVYSQRTSIKSAAEQIGRTPTAVYKALTRIHRNLHQCIECQMSKAIHPGETR